MLQRLLGIAVLKEQFHPVTSRILEEQLYLRGPRNVRNFIADAKCPKPLFKGGPSGAVKCRMVKGGLRALRSFSGGAGFAEVEDSAVTQIKPVAETRKRRARSIDEAYNVRIEGAQLVKQGTRSSKIVVTKADNAHRGA